MSLKTWKQEFYRVSAQSTAHQSWKRCLRHSILKWTGLLKTNLKRHGLTVEGIKIKDSSENALEIDSASCSLCLKARQESIFMCTVCPLAEYLGGRCDAVDTSPYSIWEDTGDARPMLATLKRTLAKLKKVKS